MNLKEKILFLLRKVKKFVNYLLFFFVWTIFYNQAQRKYELELENRRTCEQNLEEVQRILESEKQARNQMGVTNREWTERVTNLERQVK